MKDPNINIHFARLLIRELIRRGVTCFVVSPGSRSAPLTIAAHEEFDSPVVIIDERAAAYFALGYARSAESPAAVITTSGTAAANLFPAVIEAYHSRLPLIVLTADRPEELQNCGANQTINQTNLFGVYAAGVTFEAPTDHTDPNRIIETIDDLWKSIGDGPLHLNCRFREPLAPSPELYDFTSLAMRTDSASSGATFSATQQLSPEAAVQAGKAAEIINAACNGLIVVGPQLPAEKTIQITALAERLNWPVAADILSQIRFAADRKNILSHYDLYADTVTGDKRLTPEAIIHIGGLPTSKRLNQYLSVHKGIDCIKIQSHSRTIDPDHLETMRVVADVDLFLDQLLSLVDGRTDDQYLTEWVSLEQQASQFLSEYFADDHLTEPGVAYRLGQLLPPRGALFLSNSMPVRDADCLMRIDTSDLPVGCNRGVSGIDGVIASACGFAAGCERPTTLLIGDTAFLHDVGSLAIAVKSHHPIIIIVLNNNGGGIFSFLPIADFPAYFKRYFAVPHDLTFDAVSAAFKLPYHRPTTGAEFDLAYRTALEQNRSAVIEITSDRGRNRVEHETIRAQLRKYLWPREAKR